MIHPHAEKGEIALTYTVTYAWPPEMTT